MTSHLQPGPCDRFLILTLCSHKQPRFPARGALQPPSAHTECFVWALVSVKETHKAALNTHGPHSWQTALLARGFPTQCCFWELSRNWHPPQVYANHISSTTGPETPHLTFQNSPLEDDKAQCEWGQVLLWFMDHFSSWQMEFLHARNRRRGENLHFFGENSDVNREVEKARCPHWFPPNPRGALGPLQLPTPKPHAKPLQQLPLSGSEGGLCSLVRPSDW